MATTWLRNLLISIEREKMCGSARFEIKLKDPKLAKYHWPSCAENSDGFGAETRRTIWRFLQNAHEPSWTVKSESYPFVLMVERPVIGIRHGSNNFLSAIYNTPVMTILALSLYVR